MKNIEITLEGRTAEIKLNELSKSELEHMIEIAIEFENYEMCSHLKKYIDLLN
jgi:hypothetical protein